MEATLVIGLVVVWWLLPKLPPETWPRITGPIIQITSRRGYLAVPLGQESGIERIYIAPTGHYDPCKDLAKQNVLATIKGSNQTVAIPPNTIFDIVVVVRAFEPEAIACASKENLAVGIKATGTFKIPFKYSTDD